MPSPSSSQRFIARPDSGLPESYRRWRSSRLGQITDALEEHLILDLLGPVEGLRVLDIGCGDGALGSLLARVLKPGGRLVIGELGRWSAWAAIRCVRGWLGAPTWRLARFRTVKELRSLVEAHGLNVNRIAGAIYYPPVGLAAVLLARFDVAFALGRASARPSSRSPGSRPIEFPSACRG